MTYAMVCWRYPKIYLVLIVQSLCLELGILVWQDFAFGCGQVRLVVSVFVSVLIDNPAHVTNQYPAYDSFLENVTIEAEQNVKRLRHHPSVVIFGKAISMSRIKMIVLTGLYIILLRSRQQRRSVLLS